MKQWWWTVKMTTRNYSIGIDNIKNEIEQIGWKYKLVIYICKGCYTTFLSKVQNWMWIWCRRKKKSKFKNIYMDNAYYLNIIVVLIILLICNFKSLGKNVSQNNLK